MGHSRRTRHYSVWRRVRPFRPAVVARAGRPPFKTASWSSFRATAWAHKPGSRLSAPLECFEAVRSSQTPRAHIANGILPLGCQYWAMRPACRHVSHGGSNDGAPGDAQHEVRLPAYSL